MRMFPRNGEEEVPVMPVSPDAGVDPALVQAIDTVARRLVELRARVDDTFGRNDFPDVGEHDWNRIEARVQQLIKGLDRGQGPFEAAYNLLKQRAEHEQT